ncbi:unnamed protein product [Clavelina lepadiformis]|uniref:NADH dehydrogenase [ubiquinone] 1 beta subcomplex subunit 5, mitochondrial n=1 Tax=Clavelina lepadiformis TaxID=159417 RepID=A0ABP0GHX7_CLALP
MTLLSKALNLTQQFSSRIVLSSRQHNGKILKCVFRSASGGPRVFRIKALQSTGLKPLLYRYLFIGLVPAVLIITYSNLFVGNAVLYDHDAEEFEPEYWEYYKHPITRFLARYVMEDPKLSYYKDIFMLEVDQRCFKQTKLINQVESLQKLEKQGIIALHQDPALTRWENDEMEEFVKKYDFGDKPSDSKN